MAKERVLAQPSCSLNPKKLIILRVQCVCGLKGQIRIEKRCAQDVVIVQKSIEFGSSRSDENQDTHWLTKPVQDEWKDGKPFVEWPNVIEED